jgi:hypothetical protein
MHSPEHRANILTGEYRFVGVAVMFTGTHAWNTFDFVDVYSTDVQPLAHTTAHKTRSHPAQHVAAVTSRAPHNTRPAHHRQPPTHHRQEHHASRPTTRVEALRSVVVPARSMARMAALAVPVADVAAVLPRPDSNRRLPAAVAVAVLVLVVAARRWVLVVAGPVR